LALEGTGTAPKDLADAETGVQVALANVQAASFQAGRSTLVAPAAGLVLDVAAEDGQTVGAGSPVVHFAASDGWEVPIQLPSSEALSLSLGTPADVEIGGAHFAAEVVEKAGGAGALGGWEVTLAIDPQDRPLAVGLVAHATLHPAPLPTQVIPLAALAEADGDTAFVYVVDAESVAHRTPVHVAWFDGEQVALAEGPPLGSEIVVKGVPFVRDGGRVARGVR
jgi:multidrug efflux pump subunit AcrA (membrane-fusion protein)